MSSRFLATCIFVIGISIPPAHAVEFKFGWKPGMICGVDHVVTKTSAGPQSANFTMTIRVSAAPADTVLIEVLNARPMDAVAERELSAAGVGPAEMASMFQPSFFVKEGAFVKLEDTKPFRDAWRKVILAHPTWSADPSKIEGVLDKFASSAMQEMVARLFWNTAVESWVGVSADVGDELTFEGEEVLPIVQVPYKSIGKLNFVSMQPCRDGETVARCALLRTTQQPDPASLKEALVGFARMFGAAPEDPVPGKIEVFVDTELLTDPSTLVPSRVRLRKHMTVSGLDLKDWKDFSARETREWKVDCTDR